MRQLFQKKKKKKRKFSSNMQIKYRAVLLHELLHEWWKKKAVNTVSGSQDSLLLEARRIFYATQLGQFMCLLLMLLVTGKKRPDHAFCLSQYNCSYSLILPKLIDLVHKYITLSAWSLLCSKTIKINSVRRDFRVS